MESIIAGMLIWISLQMRCEPPSPSEVVFASEETLDARVYGGRHHGGTSLCGLYDPATQSSWLSEDFRADDLISPGTLVHELVHHVQTVTEMVYPCLAAQEPLSCSPFWPIVARRA